MAFCEFKNVAITGVAATVPKVTIFNKDANIPPSELEAFIKKIGVKERHIAIPKQTGSDLAFESARKLLTEKAIATDGIDALIYITQSSDYIVPATAHVIANRLNLSNHCLCFDVNLGCSSFSYGVHLASSLIVGSKLKKVLVAIGDSPKDNDYGQSNTNMLFGDAGTAILVEERFGSSINSMLCSDGKRYTSIITKIGGARHPVRTDADIKEKHTQMSGEDILAFTIADVPRTIKEFLDKMNFSADLYDYIVLHQANLMTLQIIAKKLHVAMDKVPVSLDRYGNTNGSTVPLTICDLKTRESLPEKLRILASGFGVGLSWGVTSFEIEAKNIFPIQESNDYYVDAF